MKLSDTNSPTLGRIPLPAWANVLSLDAVFVAVVWQQLLMRVFCNRSTRWSEGLALSITVWLIYVADRLLDGAKLNMDQPHTLRHRFYRRHRRNFVWLWVLGLLINTLVVVRWLPTELLRNGLILASAVLVYGASVHFSSKRSLPESAPPEDVTVADVTVADVSAESFTAESQRFRAGLPKEVRVGVLFALGVSLTTWTQLFLDLQNQSDSVMAINNTLWPLLVTTCVLALLFSWNCILVARFEREYDRAQAFPSIATRSSWMRFAPAAQCIQTRMAAALLALALLILLVVHLPLPIEIAGLASALGLIVSVMLPTGCVQRISRAAALGGSPAIFDVRGAWVDAVLWTPPLVLLCWM